MITRVSVDALTTNDFDAIQEIRTRYAQREQRLSVLNELQQELGAVSCDDEPQCTKYDIDEKYESRMNRFRHAVDLNPRLSSLWDEFRESPSTSPHESQLKDGPLTRNTDQSLTGHQNKKPGMRSLKDPGSLTHKKTQFIIESLDSSPTSSSPEFTVQLQEQPCAPQQAQNFEIQEVQELEQKYEDELREIKEEREISHLEDEYKRELDEILTHGEPLDLEVGTNVRDFVGNTGATKPKHKTRSKKLHRSPTYIPGGQRRIDSQKLLHQGTVTSFARVF